MQNVILRGNTKGDLQGITVFAGTNGDSWVRFQVEGTWSAQTLHIIPNTMQVTIASNGDISVVTQKLVRVEEALNLEDAVQIHDRLLRVIEDTLRLMPNTIQSSANYIGASSNDLDYLMTEEERAITLRDL